MTWGFLYVFSGPVLPLAFEIASDDTAEDFLPFPYVRLSKCGERVRCAISQHIRNYMYMRETYKVLKNCKGKPVRFHLGFIIIHSQRKHIRIVLKDDLLSFIYKLFMII